MTISTLAQNFKLRSSALRYYERLGILHPAGRISGKRVYDAAGESRLAFILRARESGLTLPEIRALLQAASNGVPPRTLWKDAVKRKTQALQKRILALRQSAKLLRDKGQCRCRTLNQCESLISKQRIAKSGARSK